MILAELSGIIAALFITEGKNWDLLSGLDRGLLAFTSTALDLPWIPISKINSSSSLSWSLYIISLGQAGYNPSLQAFGAEQLENEDELPSSKNDQSSNEKTLFFHWWYFGICCGSLLGFSLMSYIQDTLGWGLGFSIPAVAMVTSIAVFSCGNRLYSHKKVKGLEIKSFINVFQAVKARVSQIINGGITHSSNKLPVAELE